MLYPVSTYYLGEDGFPLLTPYLAREDGRILTGQYSEGWINGPNFNFNSTDDISSSVSDGAHFVRAMMVFIVSLTLYFIFLCCICERQGPVTKKDVDRSLIQKRVLPHGQSRIFGSSKDKDCDSNNPESSQSCCSIRLYRNNKRAVTTLDADEILAEYRSKSHRGICKHCNSPRAQQIHHKSQKARTSDDDELVLAEEGLNTTNEENLCAICIEPFRVNETVAVSKLGNCKHIFHYECILPWAVLGNQECPVCREIFWARQCVCVPIMNPSVTSRSAVEDMKKSRFCVQHGLVSPSIV